MKKKAIHSQVQPVVICFCPICHNESFMVKITGGGKYNHTEFGTALWCEGTGECDCGYKSYHTDSSI